MFLAERSKQAVNTINLRQRALDAYEAAQAAEAARQEEQTRKQRQEAEDFLRARVKDLIAQRLDSAEYPYETIGYADTETVRLVDDAPIVWRVIKDRYEIEKPTLTLDHITFVAYTASEGSGHLYLAYQNPAGADHYHRIETPLDSLATLGQELLAKSVYLFPDTPLPKDAPDAPAAPQNVFARTPLLVSA